jgi:hypothetical protein
MKSGEGTMICVLATALCGTAASAGERCDALMNIGGVQIWRTSEGALVFETALRIDADGAPSAYHPEDTGIDRLANAGKPGNWYGIVTDDGTPRGKPIVQGPTDPAPGYYVSATALEDPTRLRTDPRRYVDSTAVPYIVLPPSAMAPLLEKGPRLGDYVRVTNTANNHTVWAIVADIGPGSQVGEGSIALAEALGLRGNPKSGGAARGIRYVVYPSSGNKRPRTADELVMIGEKLAYTPAPTCR